MMFHQHPWYTNMEIMQHHNKYRVTLHLFLWNTNTRDTLKEDDMYHVKREKREKIELERDESLPFRPSFVVRREDWNSKGMIFREAKLRAHLCMRH